MRVLHQRHDHAVGRLSRKSPSETEIRQALANNLCRCGTHLRIARGVKRAAGNI